MSYASTVLLFLLSDLSINYVKLYLLKTLYFDGCFLCPVSSILSIFVIGIHRECSLLIFHSALLYAHTTCSNTHAHKN